MADARDRLVERDDAVLLVIDVQERLLPHIHEGGRLVENVARLARFAGIVGIPVLWAEQEKLGATPGAIRAELEGRAPVPKSSFGALGCGDFKRELEALGRNTLVLAGIEAHICVAQTALQALPRYRVHVVADAVASRTPENREIALARLRDAGAVVTSVEMFLYEVLGRAGTDEFRAVLPLVK